MKSSKFIDLSWRKTIRSQGEPRPISYFSLERRGRRKRMKPVRETLSAAMGLVAAMGIAFLIPFILN